MLECFSETNEAGYVKIGFCGPMATIISTEYSASWVTNSSSASERMPRTLRKPKVHHRVHNRPPPYLIPKQSHLLHAPSSYFFSIHWNIIIDPVPRYFQEVYFRHISETLNDISSTQGVSHILPDFITITIQSNSIITLWEVLNTLCRCTSSPVTGLEWPRGFQEVKVPRFHDNGTGWW